MVFNVGCPRTDIIAQELQTESYKALEGFFANYGGVGTWFDLNKTFLLVSQHTVTTEYGSNRLQVEETLAALDELKIPTIMLWPNPDAGSDDISKGIRSFRENNNPTWLHLIKNLPTGIYTHLLNTTACLIGNSSSGIRDGAFIGTPVVDIGTRQKDRLRAENVIQCDHDRQAIVDAIRAQLNHGKYEQSFMYGDGTSGKKIADILSFTDPIIQKTITY